MIKEDSLSTLIQSLSMNEKRYFKLFSEKHIIGEQNKYSLLFDFLVKNPESTENDIKSFSKNINMPLNMFLLIKIIYLI